MLKYIIFFILAYLPVHADETKLLAMIDYITRNSKYEYKDQTLPTVAIKTTEQMCKELYIGEIPDPCYVAGYFNHESNEIFIADKPLKSTNTRGFYDSVLLHELVHFLQSINGEFEKVSCRRELEKDAFSIQDKYIDEFSLPEELHNDPLFALMASMCDMFDDWGAGGG